MRWRAMAARVHVQTAAEEQAIEAVEEGVKVFLLAQGREEDREPARGKDGVDVADVQAEVGMVQFTRGEEVGVDTDERPRLRGHRFPSLNRGPSLLFRSPPPPGAGREDG